MSDNTQARASRKVCQIGLQKTSMLASVVLSIVMLAGCTGVAQDETDPPLTPDRASADLGPDLPPARDIRPQATIAVVDAFELVAGAERVWMWTGNSVTSIDPVTNEQAEVIDLPFEFGGMVEAAGVLWFADFARGVVHRYDLATETWLEDVPVDRHPNRISLHEGSVWVANGHGRWVSRIDATTGEVVGTWSPLEQDAAMAAPPARAYWGTSADSREVFAIDPEAGTLAVEVAIEFVPCAAHLVGGGVLVAPCIEHGQQPQVQFVDTSEARADEPILLPGWAAVAVPVEGRVWMPLFAPDDVDGQQGVDTMIALDPATTQIVDAVRFDPPAYGAAIAFDALWISTRDSVLRMEVGSLQLED